METSIYELLFFLFCYSFLGWCAEVIYMAVRTGKFCNRGLLNLPLCFSYGVAMDLLIVVLPTLAGAYVLQFVACMVIVSVCAQIGDEVSRRLTGKKLWNQEEHSIYFGRRKGFAYTLALSGLAAVILALVHPLLFLLCQMVPSLILKAVALALAALLAVDLGAVLYTTRKKPVSGGVLNLTGELQEQKRNLGNRLAKHIWKRLKKAYPNLTAADEKGSVSQEKDVFAGGLCLDKLIWIFFIGALGGDIIETFYVRLTAGVWMSRSSVIYGTFSVVWGFGAALLTMLLQGLAEKEDRYVFLGGFFLGGTYEYMCSVFTELVFGTVFWDYSDMPFNIGGRTNLLFCVFWGVVSLVWVKFCYPPLSRWIEKIPPLAGKIVTWIAVTLMVCDLAVSGLAMVRYVERSEGIQAENTIEEFLDYQYPDGLVEFIWPNLRIKQAMK